MKKKILWVLIDLIPVAIFNLIFFICNSQITPWRFGAGSTWVAYVIIHLAYAMVALTPVFTAKSRRADVLGYTLYIVSTIHLAVQLVVGCLFIWFGSGWNYSALEFVWDVTLAAGLVMGILFLAYLAVFLVMALVNKSDSAAMERQAMEDLFVKDTSSRIRQISAKFADNQKAVKLAEKAHDEIHSAPIRSYPEVKDVEMMMQTKVTELEMLVLGTDEEKDAKIVNILENIIYLNNERTRRINMVNASKNSL